MLAKLKNVIGAGAISFALCVSLTPIYGQQNADNTKVNQSDRAKAEPTADQGRNNLSDRDLMQKIRRSVVEDKSLSTYAHNIKIIAQSGKVTLKDSCHSEEKRVIEQKATEVGGAGNVSNGITVKPPRTK